LGLQARRVATCRPLRTASVCPSHRRPSNRPCTPPKVDLDEDALAEVEAELAALEALEADDGGAAAGAA
jgi:hypothetical protein